ncbi:MAG: hypothetical protein OZ948_05025 [Deltaproteobacteria bacterium]|nr:hypothetical protein [Deltaproteobacteria bacterium]
MARRTDPTPASDDSDALALSLVSGDLGFRLQRAIGLIPRAGLGVGRRALVLAALTWLPIAAWATWTGRAAGGAGEPLLQHFGVSVRCLVAIPLFVLAEAMAHTTTRRIFPYFLHSGLVPEPDHGRFAETLHGVARLRDRAQPWLVLAVLVAAWTLAAPTHAGVHELVWAEEAGSHRLGFGGFWFAYVVRPLYLLLALAWLWRLFLLAIALTRVARLPLAIVPTHPDRAGGLGFLGTLPRSFALVVLGVASVVAARWAHEVVYHGLALDALRLPMIGFVVLMLVLVLAPLLAFAPRLAAARRAALLDYGALVGRHGRLVHQRWIEGRPLADDALLGAPELGPVADTLALHGAVRAMRPVPLDRGALLAIALPAALPMLAVVAIRIPIQDLLREVLKAMA